MMVSMLTSANVQDTDVEMAQIPRKPKPAAKTQKPAAKQKPDAKTQKPAVKPREQDVEEKATKGKERAVEPAPQKSKNKSGTGAVTSKHVSDGKDQRKPERYGLTHSIIFPSHADPRSYYPLLFVP